MNDLPRELDDETHAKIVALTHDARELEFIEEWEQATAKLEEALSLVPEPKWDWSAATWILTVLGDIAFKQEDYERARESFRQAILCPNAVDNPFLRLRRGQTFFELGDMHWAAEELTGAYMLAGREIFEEDDPKYFEYLKSVLRPPASGEW